MNVRYIFLLICLSITFAVLNLSCGHNEPDVSDPKTAEQILSECATLMKVTFPPSTQLLHFVRLYGMDDIIFLKIQIKKGDMQNFVESSLFAGKHLRNDRRYGAPNDSKFRWWDPETPNSYKSGQVRLPNAKCLNILIDLDHEENLIVYLEWFET